MIVCIPKGLTGYEIATYTYLVQSINPEMHDDLYISPRLVGMNIGFSSVRTPQYIQEALDGLIEKKFICAVKLSNSNIYKVDLTSIATPEKYIKVPSWAIRKIIDFGGRTAATLLSFFVNVLDTRDSKDRKGHYSLATLGKINGCNIQTAISCMKKLEDLEILGIIHNHRNDGTCNTYWLKGEKVESK